MSGADFAALLPDVARRLLGDPPRATDAEWRYGSHGSLSVHPARGTWRDFEAATGGGTLALIEHVAGCDKAGALQWLVAARLIAPPAGPGRTPAAPRRPGGTSTPPAPPAPALAPPAPKPAPTADVAAAILAAAVPADATPARRYLDRRGTWPMNGPPLPAAVRWLPPSAWEHLPTWPGPDGRPRRLAPPADGIRSLRPGAPPVSLCGAVVFELARPGCAPNAATVEAVTAAGARPAERWRRTVGAAAGRILEVAAPPGDGWPDADAAPLVVALVEGEADGLALARLRLPGVLIRAAGGTAGMIGGAALGARPASGDGRLPGERRRPARSRRRREAARRSARRWPRLLRGGATRRRPGRSATRRRRRGPARPTRRARRHPGT